MQYKTVQLGGGEDGGTLTVYARSRNPENTPKTRPALLLIPGGGYNMVSFREGEPVALRFLAAGYAVFLLNYTVRAAHPVPFGEACAAMDYIRSHAGEYGVDPHHVCAMGFSAGGHLAGLLATAHADGRPDALPDAVVLGYPVVTAGEFAHEDTMRIGSGGDPALRQKISVEARVTAESAPVFLWHTAEDGLVPVENSLLLAERCRRCGVPFEMHIFERGCHGLSTADAEVSDGGYPPEVGERVPQWIPLALSWLASRGFQVT